MASNPEIEQPNFVESSLYCLNNFPGGLPQNLLMLCEPYLQHEMTIDNKIVIAGIFAKNKH